MWCELSILAQILTRVVKSRKDVEKHFNKTYKYMHSQRMFQYHPEHVAGVVYAYT